MAQLNITLNQEEIQALLLEDTGEGFKKILQACLNKLLQVESAEQLKAAPYGYFHSFVFSYLVFYRSADFAFYRYEWKL